jgi:hypothetical protein
MTTGSAPPTAAEVSRRLRWTSALADLSPGRRLDAKIGLDAARITSRLRRASDLRDLCVRLARLGRQR